MSFERPRLIPNARKAPRMLSVQALAGIAALQVAWTTSPDLQAMLPAGWVQGITLALAVLGVIGRLIDQPATK